MAYSLPPVATNTNKQKKNKTRKHIPYLMCLAFLSLSQCSTPNHSSTTWCMLLYSLCTQCMEINNLSQVCVDLFLWRQKQESNRCSITSEDSQTQTSVVDSVLQCTQNVLCFSTEGYEKPWSLNSMSGMSGDASGVSSVSALPCSPPCLMQHSHSPIPSIM